MPGRAIKVLLFGPARDALDGKAELDVELLEDRENVLGLRSVLWESFPELRHVLETSIFAVNNRMVPKKMEAVESIKSPNPEIVLVPPVSGG